MPNLVSEWDKTFPKSEKVNHSKVTFNNRYGITLVADMYIPKNAKSPMPAIAVSGPLGLARSKPRESTLRKWPSVVS